MHFPRGYIGSGMSRQLEKFSGVRVDAMKVLRRSWVLLNLMASEWGSGLRGVAQNSHALRRGHEHQHQSWSVSKRAAAGGNESGWRSCRGALGAEIVKSAGVRLTTTVAVVLLYPLSR